MSYGRRGRVCRLLAGRVLRRVTYRQTAGEHQQRDEEQGEDPTRPAREGDLSLIVLDPGTAEHVGGADARVYRGEAPVAVIEPRYAETLDFGEGLSPTSHAH